MSTAQFGASSFSFQTHEPVTPESGLRPRGGTPRPGEGTPGPGADVSPTSSTMSNGSARILESSRALYRPIVTSAQATPARKAIVRADASLFTCFDSADKELYDLWVPKP